MSEAKRVKYKSFSGLKLAGREKVSPPTDTGNHMERAFYLTSQLESPTWGSVQNYDGAGMSGGPMHWVAVYPQTMRQGGLWGLLRAIEHGSSPAAQGYIEALWSELAKYDMYVATDGKLRSTQDGSLISGEEIRNVLSPIDGKIGRKGSESYQRSELWIHLFHDVLSHPGTWDAQKRHSIEYLCNGAKGSELKAYRMFVPGIRHVDRLKADQLGSAETDLALCVYHSFSPNAPGKAKSVLEDVIKGGVPNFGRRLIKALGTSHYGRWHDTPDGRNRYDRTRLAAHHSGLWSQSLVNDLMPRDF